MVLQNQKLKQQKINLRSSSKINLALWIKEKRIDGYHELETIFYENKDLYDELEICFTNDSITNISVLFTEPGLYNEIPREKNLAYIAASKLLNKIGVSGIVEIKIKKLIPFEAGLGGGSSNAAFVLRGLNEMFHYPLNESELLNIASDIGSDVPFFIIGGTCLGKGRGEILTTLKNKLSFEIKIIKSVDVSVSTKWAYELIDAREFISDYRKEIDSLIDAMQIGDYNLFFKNLFNDFEKIIFSNFPTLITLRNKLFNDGYGAVGLCGSGSALYALKRR